MAYKFLNGWKNFRIIAHRPTGAPADTIENTKTFNFSFRFASFVPSYEKQSIRREYLNGKKRKTNFNINLKWAIDYPKYIEADDLAKFLEIENLDMNGWTFEIIPHIDVKELIYKIILIDEPKEYGLQFHHRGKKSTAHQGYKFAVESCEPVKQLDIVKMDEYIGNANVKVNPIKING